MINNLSDSEIRKLRQLLRSIPCNGINTYVAGSGISISDTNCCHVKEIISTGQGPQGPVGPQGPQGIQGEQGIQGIQGIPGAVGGKYGSFYDTTNQTGGSIRPFTLNTTDFSDGISIVSGSQITFTTLGKYNIAFSAQVIKTGGTGTNIWIWLRHQGVDVPDSATVLEMGNNDNYKVAAWNFFVNVNTNPQYFELMWYTPSANVSIGAISDASTPVGVPGVPSIILTVNQVG